MVRAARHAGDGLFAAGGLGTSLLHDPTLARIGAAHGCLGRRRRAGLGHPQR